MKKKPLKYRHAEAFCLMTYACHCGHQETIWNSRDGVTPFGSRCPSCKNQGMLGTLSHIKFHEDKCEPEYKLNYGQRFWRDGTPDEAVAIIRRRLEGLKGTEWEKTPAEVGLMLVEVRKAAEEEYSGADIPTDWHEFQKGWPMLDINLSRD